MAADKHGFWQKCFCLTNLISHVDEVTAKIDRSKRVEVCFPDFQKASEFVNHGFLDQKVKAFGAGIKMNNWIAQGWKGGSSRARVEGCL